MVEGHGEDGAAPNLVTRLWMDLGLPHAVWSPRSIRCPKRRLASCYRERMAAARPAPPLDAAVSTAEELYELAKRLPVRERLRLVERIAHDLAAPADASRAPAGRRAGVSLLGQVMEVCFEPPRFTLQTGQDAVSFRATPQLVEAARAALGKDALVEADALRDPDGAILEASATTLRVSVEAENLLDVFEATFGSGREAMSTDEGRRFLQTMRGGIA